ncbi:MAG: crotonase/enoyl-CoA hydratase family protein [Pseudomonadota bacterium]
MPVETLEITRDDRDVTTVWLNRPEKHNALNAPMMDDLRAMCDQVAHDGTRVLILAARGKSFCAGGDLTWMRAQFEAAPDERDREGWRLAGMLRAINDLPMPVIGRLHGNAFGGGCGIAAVCDVAVALDGIKLGFTETKLGLIPATIGPYVMARMGPHKARRVFMSSRVFGAREAVDLNLVSHTVAADGLDAAIEAEVAPYLACAPGAVADAKALARQLSPVIDDAVLQQTITALAARWEGDEAQDGISAFFEKRKASWVR